jgi:hypothetical protein
MNLQLKNYELSVEIAYILARLGLDYSRGSLSMTAQGFGSPDSASTIHIYLKQ